MPQNPSSIESEIPSGPGVERPSDPFPYWIALLFFAECAFLAWSPADRQTWLLENLIAIPFAIGLVVYRRRLALSTGNVILLFVFLGLHEVGSHYTYSAVPLEDWFGELVPARNHYDRFVHFSFGLLVTPSVRELLGRALPGRGRLASALTVAVMLAISTLYELLEWAAAQVVDPAVGLAFVGAQGDVWDSQKDTALALLGALVATGGRALARSRDRRRESD